MEKIRNILKNRIFAAFIVAFMLISFTGCEAKSLIEDIAGIDISSIIEIKSDEKSAPFEVRMLDVGQGLCILVKAEDQYIMYDGGGRNRSAYVASYLKKHGIRSIDYMIASHYDDDHINGLVGALSTVNVNNLIMPDYETDSNIYEAFRNKIKTSGANKIYPGVGDSFETGNATIKVVGPRSYSYHKENNRSVAVRITYKEFSLLITGDAETEAERDMIDSGQALRSDLYVVGHHGSSTSNSSEFVNKINPKYAFISVGKDNRYHHPNESTLETLKNQGIEIYRTDELGEVTAYTDGSQIWLSAKQGSDKVENKRKNKRNSRVPSF